MSDNTIKSKSVIKKNDIYLKVAVYLVSILLSYFLLKPIYQMFRDMFTGTSDTPFGESIEFVKAWKRFFKDMWHNQLYIGFKNSIIATFTSTIFCMYVSALTAYAITAYEWKLKEVFDKMIIVVMMIPSTIASVGFYQMIYKFGMVNKLSMLIIPAIASPITVFFMRMYLQSTFSMEIVESARLDGAGEYRIFNQIILPILKPAIATQAIFAFVTSWSNEFVPTIILIDSSKKTLPIAFSLFTGDAGMLPVQSILSVVPPILVYAFLSKHIVEGISLGSVKF